MSVWEERVTHDGSWTLFHTGLAEACHSRSGAWQQALGRYAAACRLAERAQSGELRQVRLLDVGTGLGLNLAAALAVLEPSATPLHATTLELELSAIERGIALYARLPSGPWEPWHGRVRRSLAAALAAPGRVVPLEPAGSLVLQLGDARTTISAAGGPFDAVFLDPFSPRKAPELWSPEFLAEVARRMAGGAWLSTYSAAFVVRHALAAAGLRVGRGARVGAKGEGTVASPDGTPPELRPRLARRLARRLEQRLAAAGSPGASGHHTGPSEGLLGPGARDPAGSID